jgi:AcrR family transcriptional regulator
MTPAARQRSRRGEGERLRDEILTAADELLVETASEDAVSIRAVADAVGVTPPSIYRHFPDKESLLVAVCLRSFDAFAEVMRDAQDPDDPIASLRALARAYVRYGIEHPEHYRIMFMDRLEMSTDEYIAEMMSESSSFAVLLDTVRALKASGRLRSELLELDDFHLGVLLWSTVHGLTSLFVAKPTLPWVDREGMIGDACNLILHGVLARS